MAKAIDMFPWIENKPNHFANC